MKKIRLIIALLSACVISLSAVSQESGGAAPLTGKQDSLIAKEISLFASKGQRRKAADPVLKAALREIPLRLCKKNELYFALAPITTYSLPFVHLFFKKDSMEMNLDSISLATHSGTQIKFPAEALEYVTYDYPIRFSGKGKAKALYSRFYRAFYSKDKKRFYIYMQCGFDYHSFEVTWIIVDGKYYKRVTEDIL